MLSSQITASARATLEPSIGASLILPILWAEEASEISAVQAATCRGGVYRAQRVAAALHTVSYPAAAVLAGMAALVVMRPRRRTARAAAPSHRDHEDASRSANGAAPSSATDRLWAGSSSGAPVAAPPTLPVAPAPAVATTGGGVNPGAGFGAGLLAPFLAMPDTADERTLQLLDEEDEDGEGKGEG
ncbi:hypothetical protein PLESTB_001729300 [Pleodorina starrii]|uniref:Uncharacterized protein n=1 Tax=Pleodorina starrii TaxID=330485 RepID=A0A9W6C0E9_9CHLO|nr:hypothetical protein PLESTB_001729300 [Pleodorina starrii]